MLGSNTFATTTIKTILVLFLLFALFEHDHLRLLFCLIAPVYFLIKLYIDSFKKKNTVIQSSEIQSPELTLGIREPYERKLYSPQNLSATLHVIQWITPDESVIINNQIIENRFFYVATPIQRDSFVAMPPFAIDPILPAFDPSPDIEGIRLQYNPDYREMLPACRCAYLMWLKNDNNSDYAPGYAFLYFFGLEFRVLIHLSSDPENSVEAKRIVQEICMLRDRYRSIRPLWGYSTRLIEYIAVKWSLTAVELQTLISANQTDEHYVHGIPLHFRLALAEYIAQCKHITPDLAFDWYRFLKSLSSNGNKHLFFKQFKDLFSSRFTENFHQFFNLNEQLPKLSIEYYPASNFTEHDKFTVESPLGDPTSIISLSKLIEDLGDSVYLEIQTLHKSADNTIQEHDIGSADGTPTADLCVPAHPATVTEAFQKIPVAESSNVTQIENKHSEPISVQTASKTATYRLPPMKNSASAGSIPQMSSQSPSLVFEKHHQKGSAISELLNHLKQKIAQKDDILEFDPFEIFKFFGIDNSRITEENCITISGELKKIGIGIEPDVLFFGKMIEIDKPCYVFLLCEHSLPPTESFKHVRIALETVFFIATSFHKLRSGNEVNFQERIDTISLLTKGSKQRLRAVIRTLNQFRPDQKYIKLRLSHVASNAMMLIEKWAIHFLAAYQDTEIRRKTAQKLSELIADAKVQHQYNQIVLHKKLDFDKKRESLLTATEKSQSSPTVLSEKPTGHSSSKHINAQKQFKPGRPILVLDEDKIMQTEKETESARELLGRLLEDEEDTRPGLITRSNSIEASRAWIEELDTKTVKLLSNMRNVEFVKWEDFKLWCKTLSMFPDGAIEKINEFTSECFEETLIDRENDSLVINREIMENLWNERH